MIEKTRQISIPETLCKNDGHDMQNIVISLDVLQNMRFRWSWIFMKNGPKIKVNSNNNLLQLNSKTKNKSFGFLDQKIKQNRAAMGGCKGGASGGARGGCKGRFGAEGSLPMKRKTVS